MVVTKELAKRLQPWVTGYDWDSSRDLIDQLTDGALTAWQLDRVANWCKELEVS